MAASLLACGVDPRRSALFVQSHVRPTRAWSGGGLTARTARCAQVREHTELAWVLGCATPMGWLQRMTQFKAKGGGKSNLGLFSYPVLMAADVLLYRATGDSPAPARLGGVTTSPLRRPCADVPVGDDQRQHLELAQLIAGSFNAAHGQVFTVPKGIFAAGARRARPPLPCPRPLALPSRPTLRCVPDGVSRIMSLRDASVKMSKSDADPASRIDLTGARARRRALGCLSRAPRGLPDSADVISDKIRRARSDSIAGITCAQRGAWQADRALGVRGRAQL